MTEPAGFKECVEACREFVRKVECGTARSVHSYKQMKEALALVDGKSEKLEES